jgi:hypothetical protein
MVVKIIVVVLAAWLSAAAQTTSEGWQPMFDGKSLKDWRETQFNRRGDVQVKDGAIVLGGGSPLTGINWTGRFPKTGYELRFEAMRREGSDFFASVTFPVEDSFATFVTGGWGGDIVGLSSIDGWDASENETRTYFNFENGRWYSFRLQVTPERFTAWIDGERITNVNIAGRRIDLRPGPIEMSAPFGFASYATTGLLRKIEYRLLEPKR